MISDLANILANIENRAHNLSEKENEVLVEIFQNIIYLAFYENDSYEKRAGYLHDINKYLKQKLKRVRSASLAQDNISYFALSNNFIHFKELKNRDKKEVFNKFWQLLEKNANKWDVYELNNMLAYCLRVDSNELMPRGAESPLKIVRIFKAIFSAQDNHAQIESFEELMMRFSAEPEFKKALEKDGRSHK